VALALLLIIIIYAPFMFAHVPLQLTSPGIQAF
jgi:hypothetical protein